MNLGDLVTFPHSGLLDPLLDRIGVIVRVENHIKNSGATRTVYFVYVDGKIQKALHPWMKLLQTHIHKGDHNE